MVLNVVHGILIGIIPPLIVIGISAVTYYMCIFAYKCYYHDTYSI